MSEKTKVCLRCGIKHNNKRSEYCCKVIEKKCKSPDVHREI